MSEFETPPGSGITVNLSLISHTNAGKTTLARTLLGRDVGEVRDAAHVTDLSTGYVLVQSGEDTLMLWDTPGFGDTARLLSRLKLVGNPIGWFLTQVWDRWRERPLWSSQQAVKNAREQADVILYLVNAAEDPEAASYVRLEMEVLGWIGKPVIVLLNQMGPPREDVAGVIARWSDIGGPGLVRSVLPLDAFARCWVQEVALLDTIAPLLPPEKQPAMAELGRRWEQLNRARFHASMDVLARYLLRAARDRETSEEPGWQGKVVGALAGKSGGDRASRKAMAALAARLAESTAESTDELIRLHNLSGKAGRKVLERVSDDYAHQAPAPEGAAAALGGLVSGAVGGLAADVAAGGLTLGGGMIVGAILGAVGATSVARGINLARGDEESSVGWSSEFLERLTVTALLRYLAVAHFGRGRGEWSEGEHPQFWRPVVEGAVARSKGGLVRLLKPASAASHANSGQRRELDTLLEDTGSAILERLYPRAKREVFVGSLLPQPQPGSEGSERGDALRG
ncbi:MAG: GTPase domain-containing protein [Novosphingobium sp.]